MDPSEYYDFEDRRYVNPTLSRDEQLGFVNTLRDTVGRNTAQINAQTQALGSNLPSIQGGLTGTNSYFKQRYQTIPLETQVNTLKATAQAKALNDLFTNYQNQAANRYQQAYRKASARASSSGGGGGATGAYEFTDREPDGTFDSEGGDSEEEIKKKQQVKNLQNESNAALAALGGTILGGFQWPMGLLSYLMAKEYQKMNGQ